MLSIEINIEWLDINICDNNKPNFTKELEGRIFSQYPNRTSEFKPLKLNQNSLTYCSAENLRKVTFIFNITKKLNRMGFNKSMFEIRSLISYHACEKYTAIVSFDNG